MIFFIYIVMWRIYISFNCVKLLFQLTGLTGLIKNTSINQWKFLFLFYRMSCLINYSFRPPLKEKVFHFFLALLWIIELKIRKDFWVMVWDDHALWFLSLPSYGIMIFLEFYVLDQDIVNILPCKSFFISCAKFPFISSFFFLMLFLF